MASDLRQPGDAGHESGELAEAHLASERVYDAVVVRRWREVGNLRLLRVEVAHAKSGAVAGARGVEMDRITARIAGLLDEPGAVSSRPSSELRG